MTASTRNANEAAVALVHEGWNHLMSQRPLAAWGTWQRALRVDPESAAAKKALATLESAHELPLAARKVYRFRQPRNPDQRRRWDVHLQAASSDDLEAAVTAFAAINAESPDDAEAWFNHGLCLAWLGRDREAVAHLDRVIDLEADHDVDGAVEAWTLAEVLRQGGGAEVLADDLRYACSFPWNAADTERLLTLFPEIRRIQTPQDPTRPEPKAADLEVFEWLDRPFPPADREHVAASELPRVLATLYLTPGSLRLSSPRVDSLEEAEEQLRLLIGDDVEPAERAAAPLPLPFLDAAVWTVRLPEGHDRADAEHWTREIVESYYEDRWIHRPRQGLDGLSPLAASRDARAGDDAIRIKLLAVVRLREQLGARPSSAGLYQGYPFDRLRRRLGLDLADPASVDSADLSCAGEAELKALVPTELDDHQLVEAFLSAVGLHDDSIAAPIAEELLRRRPEGLRRVAADSLCAGLVRRAMQSQRPEAALEWIEQARPLAEPAQRRTLDVWRAEVLARSDRPDEAARVYRDLTASSPPADRA
jgi:tetratricopeptide (TPR) repeat protein